MAAAQPIVVNDPEGTAALLRSRATTGPAILSRTPTPLVAQFSAATIGATTSIQIGAVAAAGLTHNVTVAFWDALQPSGAGTALDSTALANLNAVIALNTANGLKTIIEHALHYPPAWVVSAVEPFKDQAGNVWSGSSGNGDQVRNWMWTSLGRGYVSDFITKVYNGLTSTNRAAVDRIRFGGGVFGELHYPTTAVASPWSYWCFGSSMQTGTGLGTGLTAAPDTNYTPFTGTTTQDNNFIAWYIGGITNWMTWLSGQLTSAGWTCDLMCLHPGYGIRSNQVHSDAGYRQALSCGEDPATVIAAYASNAQIWPWCTWINGTDGFIPPTVDSDQAAWKKVFAEAYKNNKHTRIWGENTGGENNVQMGQVFHNAMIRNLTPITGDPIYPGGTTPPAVYPGYVGMMWLNYSSLTAGGTNATLANYQGLVTHVWPTTYQRGINDSGGEFGTGSIPGTYNTDYHYDSATSLNYIAGRHHKIVRFPFLWERIQHTLGAALDSTELTRIQTYVSNAAAAGLGVILDVHNFARYTISGTAHPIGDGTLTQAHFADLWSRLSAAFVGNAGIAGYGLMNEPHDLTGTSGSYTPNLTLYDFNSSVQGWVEESGGGTVSDQSGVVHDGANALQVVKTWSSGSPLIRCNDAAGNSAVIGNGQTIAAWVQVASGTTGTWTAHMEMQNSGFSWQAGSDVSLTPGTWAQITYTPTSGVWSGHHGIGIQFTGSGLSGTPSVTVYVDTVTQGSLTGATTAPQVWENAAQAAVTAIRANDTVTPIMASGYNFSSADTWPTNHPAAFIADSANKTYYEAHVYFDDNASGAYANSYATELTDSTGESYKDVTARARTRLSHFTDWCAAQNVNGFIGEVGWPNGSDATSWNAVGAAVYVDADRAGFWITYWSTGEWFGTTYALSAYEQVGSALDTANAQAPIIEAHLSVPLAFSSSAPLVINDPEGTAVRAWSFRPRGSAILSRTPFAAPTGGVVTATETVTTTATAAGATPGVSILSNVTSGIRLILEIAWGADLTNLTGSTWTWIDVTKDVQLKGGTGIDLQMGRADESSQTQTSVLTALLDNTSGAYSLGPQSSNYPNVTRNVPVRLRVSTDSGSTWTLHYQGNAVGLTPNWDTTGKWATVTLVSSGALRQLNQGTLPATSYYAQTIPTLTGSGKAFEGLLYYWNNEGGNGFEGSDGITACYPSYPTGILSSSDPRVLTANISYLPQTIATANSTAFPVSGPIPSAWDFESGTLPSVTNTGALQFRWLCAFSSLPGTQNQPVLFWKTSASSSLLWGIWWNQNGDLWVTNGTNATGDNGYVGGHVAFGANGKAWYMQVRMTTNGSGSTIILDALSFDGTSGQFTWTATGSTTGYPTFVNFVGPLINNGNATPVMEAHMTIQNVTQNVSSVATFFQGNPGELVTDRMTRICNAANIPITFFTAANTETSVNVADTMGGQFFDTIANLLRECEATGLGLLYDGLNIGLTFVPRVLRESQQPLMTLDASSGVVVMPFAPVFDDQFTVNQAMASRRNGGSFTYTDTTSANAIGVYATSLTINQQDDRGLAHMAQWLVHVGTPTGYRYPSFTFALEKQPARIADWLTCFPACRIDVTNLDSVRSQHPSGTIRNTLEGWHEQISQFQWHVTANTTSYEPWRVIALAAATGSTNDSIGRYESDGSTVTSNVSAGGTSISVTTPSGPLWTQSSITADDFPLTVAINGYPVTVTAISGAGSPQTFTVSALAHAVHAGDAVTVYQNSILGM